MYWLLFVSIFLSLTVILLLFHLKTTRRTLASKEKELTQVNTNLDTTKKQLEEQTSNFQEIDTLKSKFVANVLHEFKTPLSLIIGPLKTDGAVISQELRGMMLRNALKIHKLIEEVLDISRLDANQYKLNLRKADIVESIQLVVKTHEYLFQKKNIELEFFTSLDYEFMFYDEKGIQRVVTNLLSNAAKFTDKGKVIVSIVKKNLHEDLLAQVVEVKVSDTGRGIEKSEQSKVFDRFYREAGHEETGTGIGLSLAKEIVELHGGKIAVKSNSLGGSDFYFTIPVVASGSDYDETVLGIKEAKEGNSVNKQIEKPSILLVDNNEDIRAFLKSQLLKDFSILESTNGEQGWEQAKEKQPDLILSDVMMPRMNGIQLCNEVKTHPKTASIPVILLTVRSSEENKIEGLQQKADDYITKPFSVKEIKVRASNLIDQRKRLISAAKKESVEVDYGDIPSEDQVLIQNLYEFFKVNISESQLSSYDIAQAVNISERQLQRKTKMILEKSPAEILKDYRLQYARKLISKKAGNISQIAAMSGFSSVSYFSTQYKKKFGVTPSDDRF